MRLAIAAACLAASLALANHVHAEGRTTATLVHPAPAKNRVIAAGALWLCDGASCVAASTPQEPIGAAECRELARQVGAVSAFEDENRILKPADLARCNRELPAAPAVTASR